MAVTEIAEILLSPEFDVIIIMWILTFQFGRDHYVGLMRTKSTVNLKQDTFAYIQTFKQNHNISRALVILR